MQEIINKKEIIYCECGCGEQFIRYDNKGRIRCFVSGHNSRGKFKEKIIVKCDFCDREFKKLSCQLNYKHHFCSISCRAKYTGQIINQTIEHREKLRQIALRNGNKPPEQKKENHWNWKGGISRFNRGRDTEFCKWRKKIFSKFNYTCQICGIRGGQLSAHHIKEWALYPELRYDVENGQCLCYDCHMELHGLKKKTA